MISEKRVVYFFLLLMASFPIIDVFNGYVLSMNYSIPIGVIYRLFCFFFLVLMILCKGLNQNTYTFYTVLFLLIFLLILGIQSVLFQNPLTLIFEDSTVLIKFFLWVLIPYFIYQHRVFMEKIKYEKIFIYIDFFFTIGLLIPYFLKIGNQTYANSNAGYKGFFFATNDITLAFIVSATFTGWYLVKHLDKHFSFRLLGLIILYFANMLCLLLLTTKTGIFYGVFLTIGLLIYFLFFQTKIQASYRLLVSFFLIVAIFSLLIVNKDFIFSALSGTVDRILYFHNLYNGNLIRLLTSSRSEYLQGGWDYFTQSNHPVLVPLFGFGFQYRLVNFGRIGLIEMDFFDLLFGFGLVGILVTSSLIIYFFILAFKKKNWSIYTLMYGVVIVYSFFVGHVFFSALSTTLLGLICGGIILEDQKEDLE